MRVAAPNDPGRAALSIRRTTNSQLVSSSYRVHCDQFLRGSLSMPYTFAFCHGLSTGLALGHVRIRARMRSSRPEPSCGSSSSVIPSALRVPVCQPSPPHNPSQLRFNTLDETSDCRSTCRHNLYGTLLNLEYDPGGRLGVKSGCTCAYILSLLSSPRHPRSYTGNTPKILSICHHDCLE